MSVAVSMYVIGFCETLVGEIGVITDSYLNDIRLYGCILTTILLICVLIGINWIIKLQFFLIGILVAALLFFFVGCFLERENNNKLVGVSGWGDGNFIDNMGPKYRDMGDGIDYNFFVMFGIFFPAATGIFHFCILLLITYVFSYNKFNALQTILRTQTTYNTHFRLKKKICVFIF